MRAAPNHRLVPSRSTRSSRILGSLLVAGATLAGAPVWGLPDLVITAMTVQGAARVGACNTVQMTVRNNGDQFSNTATLDIFLATYTQGASNQNRAEQSLFISPLQPGQQSSFPISNVDFKAAGGMTVQALVDSTQEVQESNENNNTFVLNTNVSGACPGQPPPPPTGGCDLAAVFSAPTSSSVSGASIAFSVKFESKGTAECGANKIKLMRYNGSTCSGYGSQVGGSGSLLALQKLAPGANQTLSWYDKGVTKGKYCYKVTYSSPHNDTNNGNHHPQKKLAVQ